MKIIKKIGFYIIFIGLLFIIPLSAFINMPVAKAEGSNTQNYTSGLETDNNIIEQVKDKTGFNKTIVNTGSVELGGFGAGTSFEGTTYHYYSSNGGLLVKTDDYQVANAYYCNKDFGERTQITSAGNGRITNYWYYYTFYTSSPYFKVQSNIFSGYNLSDFNQEKSNFSSASKYTPQGSSDYVSGNTTYYKADVINESSEATFSFYKNVSDIHNDSGTSSTWRITIKYSPNYVKFYDANASALSTSGDNLVFNDFSYKNWYYDQSYSYRSITNFGSTERISNGLITIDKSGTYPIPRQNSSILTISLSKEFPKFNVNNGIIFSYVKYDKEGYKEAYKVYSHSFKSIEEGLISSIDSNCQIIDNGNNTYIIKNGLDQNGYKVYLEFITENSPEEKNLTRFLDTQKKGSYPLGTKKVSSSNYIDSNNQVININNIRVEATKKEKEKAVIYTFSNNQYNSFEMQYYNHSDYSSSAWYSNTITSEGKYYLYYINDIGEVYRQFIEIDNTAISYGESIDTINNKPIKAIRNEIENVNFGIWNNNILEISSDVYLVISLQETPTKIIINNTTYDYEEISSTQYKIKLKSNLSNSTIYNIYIVDDVFNINNAYSIKINNSIESNYSINNENNSSINNNSTINTNAIITTNKSFIYIIDNGEIKKATNESSIIYESTDSIKKTIIIIDFYGKSIEFSFTIDRSDPVNILDNKKVYLETWYNTYDENNIMYSFSSEARAKAFAKYREYKYSYAVRTGITEDINLYSIEINGNYVGNANVIYSNVVNNTIYVYYNRSNGNLTTFYSTLSIDNYIQSVIDNSISELKNIEENYNFKYQAGYLIDKDNYLNLLNEKDNLYIVDEETGYNVFYTNRINLTFNQLKDNNESIRYSINNIEWYDPTLSTKLTEVSPVKLYIELTNKAHTTIRFIVLFDNENKIKIDVLSFSNESIIYYYESSTSNQTMYLLGQNLTIDSTSFNSTNIFKVQFNNMTYYYNTSISLLEEGIYTISLYDLALNYTKSLTIYYLKTNTIIDNPIPEKVYNPETEEDEETAFNFKVSYKRLSNEDSPVVRTIYYKENEDSEIITLASNISVDLLTNDIYKFNNAGIYKLIVDDNTYSSSGLEFTKIFHANSPIGYVYLFNSATGIYDLDQTEQAKNDIAKTNESFMITWIATTYSCNYEFNNATYSYIKNRKIVEEGIYKFHLINGTKETIYYILIDYTAPEGFITAYKKPNSEGISTIINNSSKGYNVKISTLENVSSVEIQYNYIDSANQTKQASVYRNLVKENDSDYFSYLFDDELYNELINKNLYNYEFKFILKDSLNNKRSYDFTIDKINPKLEIKISNKLYNTNRITSKSFSFVYSSEVKDYYMVFTGINNIEKIYSPYSNIYTSESKLTAEGEYIMTIYDLCGNSTQLSVIIDNSNPVIKLFYADNNEEVLNETSRTKRDIKVIFDENTKCVVSYEGNNSETPISSNSILSDSYKYSITAYFTNGNENFYTRVIEIDKVAPVGQLYQESISTSNKLENGAKSNKTVYLKCSERNVKAYLVIEDIEQELSFDFDNSVNVKNEGNHLIKLVDDLGNESFYNFSIKKSSPEARLELYNSNDELLSDTLYTNGYVKIFFDENWSALTKNDNNEEVVLTSNYFTQEKEYYIKIIDDYGNTNVYTFEICKDLPEGYFYNYKTDEELNYCDDLIINYDFYFKFSKHTCLINGEVYTSKTRIKDEGSYEIQLTNIYGSKTVYYITLDKTLPSMSFYSDDVYTSLIESYYYNNDVYWKIENECNVLSINEQTYTENSNYGLITLENVYTFEISDKAGNKNVITFTIDKTNPILAFYKSKIKDSNIVDLEENQEYVLTNDKTYIENIEKTSSIFVNNELVSLDNNSYLFSNEGFYEIKCIDLAGNSIQYYLIINKEIPTGILNIDNASSTNQAVKFEFDSNEFSATLNNNKYLSGDEITDEGKYEIIIYNSFGSSNNYTFTIDKTNPILVFTKEFNIYTNKSVSYDDIEKGATLYLDNEVYEKTSVSSEGAHTLKIVDKAGNYTEYKFEIKKEFDENLFTIEQDPETKHVSIKKDSSVKLILNDEEISDDEIILTEAMTYKYKFIDKYGNINEDSFRIKLPKTANNTINNVLTIIIVIGLFVVVIASVSIYIRNRSKKPKLF